MSLLVVLMVSIMATRPVNALITSRTACLRITTMDGNRFLVLKFWSRHQITNSASILSSLIEYALGDFLAAIYEVDHHVYIRTVIKIDKSYNEDLVYFMEPLAVFKSNSQTFRWPKKPDETWLKNSSVLCLILPPRETSEATKLMMTFIQNILRECKNVI